MGKKTKEQYYDCGNVAWMCECCPYGKDYGDYASCDDEKLKRDGYKPLKENKNFRKKKTR